MSGPNGHRPPTLTGEATLRLFDQWGATFCLVEAGGKRPIEHDWPNRPHSLDDALDHYRRGGNVGVLCGAPSGGLGFLDIDDGLTDFLARFPQFAHIPRVVHPNKLNAAKIVVRIPSNPPPFKMHANSRPLEWLGTGNQAVICGQHPSGDNYEVSHA